MTDNCKIPEHIAFILDGNRRWAKKRSLPVVMGHKKGAETLIEITRGAAELGLKYMTIYAFSTENWNRSEEEVKGLMELLRQYLDDGLSKVAENNITPIFDAVLAAGGCYAYKIICDETINTPQTIDNNELRVRIGVQPTKTIEFILIEFVATRTGSNWSELVEE